MARNGVVTGKGQMPLTAVHDGPRDQHKSNKNHNWCVRWGEQAVLVCDAQKEPKSLPAERCLISKYTKNVLFCGRGRSTLNPARTALLQTPAWIWGKRQENEEERKEKGKDGHGRRGKEKERGKERHKIFAALLQRWMATPLLVTSINDGEAQRPYTLYACTSLDCLSNHEYRLKY